MKIKYFISILAASIILSFGTYAAENKATLENNGNVWVNNGFIYHFWDLKLHYTSDTAGIKKFTFVLGNSKTHQTFPYEWNFMIEKGEKDYPIYPKFVLYTVAPVNGSENLFCDEIAILSVESLTSVK